MEDLLPRFRLDDWALRLLPRPSDRIRDWLREGRLLALRDCRTLRLRDRPAAPFATRLLLLLVVLPPFVLRPAFEDDRAPDLATDLLRDRERDALLFLGVAAFADFFFFFGDDFGDALVDFIFLVADNFFLPESRLDKSPQLSISASSEYSVTSPPTLRFFAARCLVIVFLLAADTDRLVGRIYIFNDKRRIRNWIVETRIFLFFNLK